MRKIKNFIFNFFNNRSPAVAILFIIFSFFINIFSSNPPPGTSIVNTAFVIYKDTSKPIIASVKTRVLVRTPGEIYFYDENWNLKNTFKVGDTLYLEVMDVDQNIDPDKKEIIVVVLTNDKTGDKETIILTETGADTGIFRGYILTNSGVPITENGILTVISDSEVTATYTDPLDQIPVVSTIAYIDPYGIVFDSITGNPVSGVTITLIDATTNQPAILPFDPNPIITGPDGKFAFQYVPAGTYYFSLNLPSGYTFPSVISDDKLPPGFKIQNGSRGEIFTLTEEMQPLNLDIPVDPFPGKIIIKKTVNKKSVSIGDIIKYTITITNNGDSKVIDIKIYDIMPHGIVYVKDSSYLNGNKISNPENGEDRTIIWKLSEIEKGEVFELVYSAVVGVDSHKGDGKNYVFAEGISIGEKVFSNRDYAKIEISEGVFSSKGTIIGKVFVDKNNNKIQDEGEKGVDNVVIYTEDGIRITTDKNGKFSIPAVNSGTKVLRIDHSTLPSNLEPIPSSNKFAGSNFSQIVDVQSHGLTKVNFVLIEKSKDLQDIIEKNEKIGIKDEEKNELTIINFEEEIKNMPSDFAFLNLKDGMVLTTNHTKIILRANISSKVNLYVNGNRVSEKQIGKKIEYPKGNVVIFEFVGIRLNYGEKNIITAEILDQFGNIRGKESINVEVTGKLEKIVISPERDSVPADGKSVLPVSVYLKDIKGNKISYSGTLTVSISSGEIKEEDVDKITSGHQILIVDGIANFNIISPIIPSVCKIDVYVEDMKETCKVKFVPYLRDMIIVGLGELKLGYGDKKGSDFVENEWFKDDFYLGDRIAFFIKGKIFKDTLLTVSYDSQKNEEKKDFFREIERNLDLEEKYPVYGDESKLDYEINSRDKLYFRIDRGMSYLMYGDYRTDLNESILSAYNRTFTGIKTNLEFSKFRFQGFGSYTDSGQFVDVIRGRGTSGYYYLSHIPVIEGSENILIETRDRYRPDIVIKREKMVYGQDYLIEYDTGGILFKFPVPSMDLNFNPVYIIVSYESEIFDKKYNIFGGRLSYKPNKNFEIGITSLYQEKEIIDYNLFGTDIKFKLPFNTTMRIEFAKTKSLFNIDGIYTPKDGKGYLFEIKSSPTEKLSMSAYYKNIDDYFDNISATEIMRGVEKYGCDFNYVLDKKTSIYGRYFDEKDKLNSNFYEHVSFGFERKLDRLKFGIEGYYEHSNIKYIPPEYPNSRYPFDISENLPEESLGLKFMIEKKFTQNFAFVGEYKSNFLSNAGNLGHIGIEYNLEKNRKIYLRELFAQLEERFENRLVLGIESELFKNTTAFNEYRLLDGMEGRNLQQSIGLRNKFMLGEKITGNISLENLNTLKGSERKDEPDAFAAGVSFEYLPRENVKMITRFEYRNATDRISKLAELGFAYKFKPALTVLLKERFYSEEFNDTLNINSRTSLGFAYRPINNDRFNMLGKIELKREDNVFFEENSYIFSFEGIYQLNEKTQISGKYAGKFAKSSGIYNYTDLIATRITRDLNSHFDISAEYRVLRNNEISSITHGGSLEIGYSIFKNVYLSFGYSFDKFDSDLKGDGYSGKGPFIRLRIKFDENIFRFSH